MVKLLESEPNRIRQWCVKVVQAGPDKAPTMLAPFQSLNYNRMDHGTIEAVEDALYFGVFGVRRPHRGASPNTGPTPRFSANRMSPSRRSSFNLSSGRPKPPSAV